jgi:hypothetical protein
MKIKVGPEVIGIRSVLDIANTPKGERELPTQFSPIPVDSSSFWIDLWEKV